MAKVIETEDGARLAQLSDLKDFQVAEGYRDIRGWRVDSSDGREVGKVHDLLVDLDGMRTQWPLQEELPRMPLRRRAPKKIGASTKTKRTTIGVSSRGAEHAWIAQPAERRAFRLVRMIPLC
jgi:hypothetical protein